MISLFFNLIAKRREKDRSQRGAIMVVIDIIVIVVVIFLAIWFIIKGYPHTLGSLIHNF